MTFAIGIGLTASDVNSEAFTYGYERLRFPRPVLIGDTIRTRIAVSRMEDDPKRPESGRVVEICEVINLRDEVVLASEHILLVRGPPNTPPGDLGGRFERRVTKFPRT